MKTGIAVLITVGICGWVACRLLYPDTTVRYNDFVIDSAVKWLKNADDADFDVCKKDIVYKNGWFNWFEKDRKSLGKVKSRKLVQRQAMSGGSNGMKRYELKFDSKFSVIKYPKGKVTEKLLVESDGKTQFKVLTADYWLSRAFEPSKLTVSEKDRQQIMDIAEKVLKKIKAKDIGFFKRAYAELAKQPDYFGWNYSIVREAKNAKRTMKLFKIMDNGNPSLLKLMELKAYVPAGRTGFECSGVRYRFSAVDKGKKENFMLQVFVDRDLYQNKSAPWEFNFVGYWKEKQEKK